MSTEKHAAILAKLDMFDAMTVVYSMRNPNSCYRQGRRAQADGADSDTNPYLNDVRGVDPCNRAHDWMLGWFLTDEEAGGLVGRFELGETAESVVAAYAAPVASSEKDP